MKTCRRMMIGAVCAAVFAQSPSLAQTSATPGRNSAFASTGLLNIPAGGSETVSVTILKGRPKRVLTVSASYTYSRAPFPGALPILSATVNGAYVNGGYDNWYVLPAAADSNAGSVSWWLDLDAAEAIYPGTFLNKPLDVQLVVWSEMSSPASMNVWATLSVRMEKK